MSRSRGCWQLLLLGLISGAFLAAVVLQDLGSSVIERGHLVDSSGTFFLTTRRWNHSSDAGDEEEGRKEADNAGSRRHEQEGKRRKKSSAQLRIEQQAGEVPSSNSRSELQTSATLYHDWEIFERQYKDMLPRFKIFVYPDAFDSTGPFSHVFTPHPNPYDKKLGNYFSEHIFKILLLNSSFVTTDPAEASLFFLPFSVNVLRNDARARSESTIATFVADYVARVKEEYGFWNRSQGADHFYVCCHSVCRDAVDQIPALRQNAIQVTCSSNIYHKNYIPHKDVSLPQIWPRAPELSPAPSSLRTRLAFFAGRIQNSVVRKNLLDIWGNDTDMDIYNGAAMGLSYEDHLRISKFCLHVRGYEVNTARLSDAIHFVCVPVVLSNHYELPLANVIDWSQVAIILNHQDLHLLKGTLSTIGDVEYRRLATNVLRAQKHFRWHANPRPYDAFYMTLYQLWLRKPLVWKEWPSTR